MAGLSVFDPIYLGIEERWPGHLDFVYYNLYRRGLAESGLQNIIAHCARRICLVLMDAKRGQAGVWAIAVSTSAGPGHDRGVGVATGDAPPHRRLVAHRLRKMSQGNELDVVLV